VPTAVGPILSPSDQPVWTGPIDRRFLFAGLAFTVLGGSALGAVNLAMVHASLGSVPPTHYQAHAHAQIFGFFALFVAGFGLQLLPRMARAPLPFPRLARAAFPLLGGGAALHFLGQPIAQWWPGRVLLGLSGLALFPGSVAFALNAIKLVRPIKRTPAFAGLVTLGALGISLAAGLDAALALSAAVSGEPNYPGEVAQPLWHLAVYGGILPFTFGMATRTLPPFLGGGPVRALPARVALGCLMAGVPAQAVAPALAGRPDLPWAHGLDLGARAVVGAGLLAAPLAFHFKRPHLRLAAANDDRFWLAARIAFGWLALAGGLRVASAAAEALGAEVNGLVLDTERHLVTIGFLLTFLTAMAPRLVPTLTRGPLRRGALRRWILALLTLGVIARCAEAFAPFGFPALLELSAWSGAVVWVGMVLFAVMMVSTLRAPGRGGLA
jgi:hypothetical protein